MYLLQDDKYTWLTYEQVGNRINRVACGLFTMGLRPGDKVMIYADTCAEWLITALACFKSSLTIVTIYTNLGKAGVSFSINQVIESHIIISFIKMSRKKGKGLVTFRCYVQRPK